MLIFDTLEKMPMLQAAQAIESHRAEEAAQGRKNRCSKFLLPSQLSMAMARGDSLPSLRRSEQKDRRQQRGTARRLTEVWLALDPEPLQVASCDALRPWRCRTPRTCETQGTRPLHM